MRQILLEDTAKEVLKKEYGKHAVMIDSELNELAKLIIKRKDCVIAFNRGNFSSKEKYYKLNQEIKKIIEKINVKLAE